MSDSHEKQEQQSGKRTVKEIIKRFFEILAEHIEARSRTQGQKQIASYLKNGGQLYSYPVQGIRAGNTAESLKESLDRAGIPYVSIGNDKNHILIRPDDLQSVIAQNRQVLVEKCNYYQEVDTAKMENAIAIAPIIDNKEILSLHNLNSYEADAIKKHCDNISPGFMVGTRENEDGTFDMAIHSKNVYIDRPGKNDFCKALLAANLSFYGPNHSISVDRIEAEQRFNETVKELKNDTTSHFIVSATDKNGYIELNSTGFEYKTRIPRRDGAMMDNVIITAERTSPDYDAELQRALNMIDNKTTISDPGQLISYMSNPDKSINTDIPVKTDKQIAYSRCEDIASDAIDNLIKRNLSEKGIEQMNAAASLSSYLNEASVIISACIENKIPDGYTRNDISEIRDIFIAQDIDISKYHNVPSQLNNKGFEAHQAEKLTSRDDLAQEDKTRKGDER